MGGDNLKQTATIIQYDNQQFYKSTESEPPTRNIAEVRWLRVFSPSTVLLATLYTLRCGKVKLEEKNTLYNQEDYLEGGGVSYFMLRCISFLYFCKALWDTLKIHALCDKNIFSECLI